MKNIIWVDKCKSAIDSAYSDQFKNDSVEIYSFDDYNAAFDFLVSSNVKIDLVISGYCTFFWMSDLGKLPKEEQICFSFFHKVNKVHKDIPFILFSSIANSDARTEIYEEIEGFYSVSKSDPACFGIIKSVLNKEELETHVH